MRTYKCYAAAQTATAANILNFTPIKAGRIKSVRWNLLFTSITAASWVAFELSFFPTSQWSTNAAQLIIDELTVNSNFVTSGLAQVPFGRQTFVDVPVGMGEKIYVHLTVGGTISVIPSLLIDIAE